MDRPEPTRLDRETHRALARQAVQFGTRTHIAYLSEALVAARAQPDDPLAALEVLVAMQGTAYAGRKSQRPGLAEVGRWLEEHLEQRLSDGTASAHLAGRIASELGWLRRLAVAEDRRAGGRGHVGTDARRFGGSLSALRARWRAVESRRGTVEAPSSAQPPVAPQTAPVDATPPAPVPTTWRAGFVDVLKARDAWRPVRKRLKGGKPLKDKRLPLAVRSSAWEAGTAIEASFSLTEGLVDVFRAFDAAGGQARDFEIQAWDDTKTPWLATRVKVDD